MFENFDWAVIGQVCLPALILIFALVLWHRREGRRTAANDAATELEKWGLLDLAGLLKAYAIGNYLGRDSITRIIHRLIHRIRDEGIPAILDKAFWQILRNVYMKTEKGRDQIAEVLRIGTAEAAIRAETPTPVPDLDPKPATTA